MLYIFVNVNGGFVVEIIETKMTECVPSNDSVYYKSLILNTRIIYFFFWINKGDIESREYNKFSH